jgi:hypothetical protein
MHMTFKYLWYWACCTMGHMHQSTYAVTINHDCMIAMRALEVQLWYFVYRIENLCGQCRNTTACISRRKKNLLKRAIIVHGIYKSYSTLVCHCWTYIARHVVLPPCVLRFSHSRSAKTPHSHNFFLIDHYGISTTICSSNVGVVERRWCEQIKDTVDSSANDWSKTDCI